MCFISVQLTISAQDLGSPPQSDVKTITIDLKNIDDNAPVFNEVQAINNHTDWALLFFVSKIKLNKTMITPEALTFLKL